MENLFEQLGRMKDLMVYEKGMSIDEVSTSRGNVPTPDTKTDNTKTVSTNFDKYFFMFNFILKWLIICNLIQHIVLFLQLTRQVFDFQCIFK